MLILDTTTWVAVGAAVGSAAIALTLAVICSVVLLRSRSRGPEVDVDRLHRGSEERLEQMLEDLSRDLDQARTDLQRSDQLSALVSTIDLDVLGERVLEAALDLPGVDAAAFSVPLPDEEPLLATAGMTLEEARRQVLPLAPEARARAVAVAYRHAEGAAEDATRICGGLAVPLRGAEASVGTLAVFWRGRSGELSESELATLEHLASGVGPAVRNAIRYRETSRLADLDALTGLNNRRFFHDTLARECARAARYDRELSLLVLDVDDFKAINDRIGHLAADSVLAQLAERVRSVVRTSDIACRVGGDEFAVILPESGLAEAEGLFRRLHFAIGSAGTGPIDRLYVSAGVAALQPGDTPVGFFERADDALYRAKQSGKGHAVASGNGA